MKRTIKTIIATGIILISVYLLSIACTEVTVYAQTTDSMQEMKDANMSLDTIPDEYASAHSEEFYNNYVNMETVIRHFGTLEGFQLYFDDGTGYYIDVDMMCENLDVIADSRIYSMIIDTTRSNQHIIDMYTVIGFDVNENGLQLYFNDGTGYWLE